MSFMRSLGLAVGLLVAAASPGFAQGQSGIGGNTIGGGHACVPYDPTPGCPGPSALPVANTPYYAIQYGGAGLFTTPGKGYYPDDTAPLVGGTYVSPATVIVHAVVAQANPTIVSAGSGGGSAGTCTLTLVSAGGSGPTQATYTGTINSSGQLASATLLTPGLYTIAPNNDVTVTGSGSCSGLTGAAVNPTDALGGYGAYLWWVQSPNPGRYTIIPQDPVALGTNTGPAAGGATITVGHYWAPALLWTSLDPGGVGLNDNGSMALGLGATANGDESTAVGWNAGQGGGAAGAPGTTLIGTNSCGIGGQSTRTSVMGQSNTCDGGDAGRNIGNGAAFNTLGGARAGVGNGSSVMGASYASVWGASGFSNMTTAQNVSGLGYGIGPTCTTCANVLLLGTSASTDVATAAEANTIHIGAGAGYPTPRHRHASHISYEIYWHLERRDRHPGQRHRRPVMHRNAELIVRERRRHRDALLRSRHETPLPRLSLDRIAGPGAADAACADARSSGCVRALRYPPGDPTGRADRAGPSDDHCPSTADRSGDQGAG